MMNPVLTSLLAYVAAASLLTMTPGLDTALVLRTAAGGHARRAALAGLGISVGCFIWAALVAMGLGTLLAASQLAYSMLRWIGAAYLLWIGYGLLRHPRREFLTAVRIDDTPGGSFATGALTNLLNPKVGMFYVSFLPQFVPPQVPVGPYILLLGGIHAVLGLLWSTCLIAATRPISTLLKKPHVVQICDRLTGGVFVAFGVTLILESRRT
jgi:threonine/homoserine/homoserine lactone efflux protein